MLTLHDIYIAEETMRHAAKNPDRRTRAPGDEGPRRPLARRVARSAGRTLVRLGRWLLLVGGERPAPELAPYLGPITYSQN